MVTAVAITRPSTRSGLSALSTVRIREPTHPTTTRAPPDVRRGPRRAVRGQSSRSLGRPASSRCSSDTRLARRRGRRAPRASAAASSRRARSSSAVCAAGSGLMQRTGDRRTRRAQLVHPLRHRGALVLQRNRVAVVVHAAERLVDLDELAVRQPPDDAGLDAVLEHRAVRPLQAEAPAVGHPVGDRRQRPAARSGPPTWWRSATRRRRTRTSRWPTLRHSQT